MAHERNPNHHCVVIPGILATNYKVETAGIKPGFEKQYGDGKVTVLNSPVSSDTPNPARFEQLRRVLAENAPTGLTFVMNSLGSAEIDAFERKDGDPHIRDNVRFVFISPSGYVKGIDKIVYVARLIRDKSRFRMGLNSLVAFPPENIDAEVIRNMFRKYSNVDKGFESVSLTEVKSNRDKLTEKEKKALSETDAELLLAIDKKRKRKVKQIIRRRGGRGVVGRPLRRFYKAAPDGEIRRLRINGLYGLKTLFRAMSINLGSKTKCITFR